MSKLLGRDFACVVVEQLQRQLQAQTTLVLPHVLSDFRTSLWDTESVFWSHSLDEAIAQRRTERLDRVQERLMDQTEKLQAALQPTSDVAPEEETPDEQKD